MLPHIVTEESETPIALEQDKRKLSLNQKLGKVFGVDCAGSGPLAAVGRAGTEGRERQGCFKDKRVGSPAQGCD